MPHDLVEGRYNDNSSCDGDATKPNITESYHRSDRSEIFRDLPVLGRRSASVPSGDNRSSLTFIRHVLWRAFGESCHPVRCKCPTSHLLEVKGWRVCPTAEYRQCDGVSGEGPATTSNNERCSQTNKMTAITWTNRKGRRQHGSTRHGSTPTNYTN